MTRRGIGCLIAVIVMSVLVVGGAAWTSLQLIDGVADPMDSSMSELRRDLIELQGVDDAGLLYPTDGRQFIGTNQGASIVLEIHEGNPGDDVVDTAIEDATCKVWREMFFEPDFVWTAVVRSKEDVVGPSDISGEEWLTPYEILRPVDTSSLVGQLGATAYENGYLKWDPEVLDARCSRWIGHG